VWLSLVELNRKWGTKNWLDLHVFGEKGSEGWEFVSTDHVCEQFGERDRRVIFVERTHNLCADRESAGRIQRASPVTTRATPRRPGRYRTARLRVS
jgi:hypothetical protein